MARLWERASPALVARYAILVFLGGILTMLGFLTASSIAMAGDIGIDAAYYRDLGARFLVDGSYYLPRQLAGAYDVALMSDVLYPPSALLLFVPAAIAPAFLWWVVPLAVSGYAIATWRPRWWAVAAILVLLMWPRAHAAFIFGNTDMWVMAGVAAGLLWGWPAVLLTLKPVFAPFALVGIRQRSWWVAAGGMIVFVGVTLPLWIQYLTVMRNLRIGADYSLASVPLMLIPVVAWCARDKEAAPDPTPEGSDARVSITRTTPL